MKEPIQYGKTAVVLAALLFLTACAPARLVMRRDAAEDLFARAERMYAAKAHDRALTLYRQYLDDYPEAYLAPAALMKQGMIHMERKRYAAARKAFETLTQRYPDSLLVPDALIRILETRYREGAYEQVIREADAVMATARTQDQIGRVYLILGNAYLAKGSAVNGVYFYTQAAARAEGPEAAGISDNIRAAAAQLSTKDIKTLLDKLKNPLIRGHLMYQLGVNYIDEDKKAEALNVLSAFIRRFPGHEHAAKAKRLVGKLEETAGYVSLTGVMPAVGCLLPLTGSYQVYGARAMRGVELALARAGGREGRAAPNILVEDTGSDEGRAAAGVRELARKNAAVIIGPLLTAEAAAAEAQRMGVPIITLTQKTGVADMGEWVFRNFLTPETQVDAIVNYAADALRLYRFAALYPSEKYGETFMNLFRKAAEARGGRMVAAEPYFPDQADFAEPIRNLRRAGGIDALFIPDAPKAVSLILPQLAFHDVDDVYLFGTNLWHSAQLVQKTRKYIQGAVFPDGFFADSDAPDVKAFVSAFQEAYGEKPGFIEAVTYDTARMLFEMFGRYPMEDRGAVRDALLRLPGFDGVTGVTAFGPGGDVIRAPFLLSVQGDRFVQVNPLGAPVQ